MTLHKGYLALDAEGYPIRRFFLLTTHFGTMLYDAVSGIFRWVKHKYPQYLCRVAGNVSVNGYHVICYNGRQVGAHRLAWLAVYGEWPRSQIDHRDNCRVANGIRNLREATPAQNSKNKRTKKPNGLKGASLHRKSGLWMARIKSDGKNTLLGYFKTESLAHAAYAERCGDYHLEFARAS